jgi:hypothetical protein
MSDFMPSNKTIDDIVEAVNDPAGFERMREALKAHLAGTTEQAAPAPRPVLSVNQSPPTDMRVFYVGNSRFEIYGTSQANLNEQELQIRALYSSRQ